MSDNSLFFSQCAIICISLVIIICSIINYYQRCNEKITEVHKYEYIIRLPGKKCLKETQYEIVEKND